MKKERNSFSTYSTAFSFKFSKIFPISCVHESRMGTNVTRRADLYSMGKFFEQTSQLTGHVDKRGGRIAVPGLVVSQTSEISLGLQINRLDGKGGVVFIGKSVKPS